MNASSCKRLDDRRIDRFDLTDVAEVMGLRRVGDIGQSQSAGANQATILAGQAYRLATEPVDQSDQLALYLAGQHPFDDFHRLCVGDTHALNERRFFSDSLKRLVDLRTATVDDDRIHAHQLQTARRRAQTLP